MLADASLIKMVFVSFLWGSTNPLIKRYSAGIEDYQSSLDKLIFLICKPLFIISLLANQLGSVLFYVLLGSTELGVAVPVVNSLTLLFTSVVGGILGEGSFGTRGIIGTLCIVCGTALCHLKT